MPDTKSDAPCRSGGPTSGLLFTNVRLGAPLGLLEGWLRVDGTRIAALGAGVSPEPARGVRTVDCAGGLLMPGFIDVHVHGAFGHEVMDASVDGLREMGRFFATHGVTSFLATTWTASDGDIHAALACVGDAMSAPRDRYAARLLGVHLEGPYLHPDLPGAQDPEHIRVAEPDEAIPYLESQLLRLITLAPDVPGNEWLVDECVARKITVSAGHTNATYDELVDAAGHGLDHITHTYNAMRGLHHREPGALGAALTLPSLRCELIVDNLHVHPAAMRAMFGLRGAVGTVLVSDSVRPTGLPDGEYLIGRRTIRLADGAVRLADGALAGSVLTMDVALRNLVAATGYDAGWLWQATSGNAAISAGVAERKGALAAGFDADLVLLDDELEVRMTVIEGELAYLRGEDAECVPGADGTAALQDR